MEATQTLVNTNNEQVNKWREKGKNPGNVHRYFTLEGEVSNWMSVSAVHSKTLSSDFNYWLPKACNSHPFVRKTQDKFKLREPYNMLTNIPQSH